MATNLYDLGSSLYDFYNPPSSDVGANFYDPYAISESRGDFEVYGGTAGGATTPWYSQPDFLKALGVTGTGLASYLTGQQKAATEGIGKDLSSTQTRNMQPWGMPSADALMSSFSRQLAESQTAQEPLSQQELAYWSTIQNQLGQGGTPAMQTAANTYSNIINAPVGSYYPAAQYSQALGEYSPASGLESFYDPTLWEQAKQQYTSTVPDQEQELVKQIQQLYGPVLGTHGRANLAAVDALGQLRISIAQALAGLDVGQAGAQQAGMTAQQQALRTLEQSRAGVGTQSAEAMQRAQLAQPQYASQAAQNLQTVMPSLTSNAAFMQFLGIPRVAAEDAEKTRQAQEAAALAGLQNMLAAALGYPQSTATAGGYTPTNTASTWQYMLGDLGTALSKALASNTPVT